MKLKNLYIALIATAAMTFWLPSHATEPAGVMVKQPVAQQSVSPLSKQAAQPVVHIKCPERVRFVMEVENVPGWGESKYSSGAKVERAQITYLSLYDQDGLQCMMGALPVAERSVEKGSCVVGPDKLSFDCKPGAVK